jgi:hypothetical protein
VTTLLLETWCLKIFKNLPLKWDYFFIYHEACVHNIPTHYLSVTCRRLCLPVPHHIHLNVDWRKSQELPPEPHRSVQLLLSAEPPVYLWTTKHSRIYQKNWPCRNLRTHFWNIYTCIDRVGTYMQPSWPGVERTGCVVNHPQLSSIKVSKRLELYLTIFLFLQRHVMGELCVYLYYCAHRELKNWWGKGTHGGISARNEVAGIISLKERIWN